MEANKAPEKIYIQSFNVSEEDTKFSSKLYFDDVWTEEPELGKENIEYTRTDAFIEKAYSWLKENKDKYLYNTGEMEEYIPTCSSKMIDEFKAYMEGE